MLHENIVSCTPEGPPSAVEDEEAKKATATTLRTRNIFGKYNYKWSETQGWRVGSVFAG